MSDQLHCCIGEPASTHPRKLLAGSLCQNMDSAQRDIQRLYELYVAKTLFDAGALKPQDEPFWLYEDAQGAVQVRHERCAVKHQYGSIYVCHQRWYLQHCAACFTCA